MLGARFSAGAGPHLSQCPPRGVEGQVLGVDDALVDVEPTRHQFITIVHEEDAAHMQLNVISFPLGLKEAKPNPAWHITQITELPSVLLRQSC